MEFFDRIPFQGARIHLLCHKTGMAHKKLSKQSVSQDQLESLTLILKDDPALFERVSEIVELSQLSGGQIRKIDDVEEELIEKIRRLGQQTLSSFGQAVEKEAAKELRSGKKGIHQREKKT